MKHIKLTTLNSIFDKSNCVFIQTIENTQYYSDGKCVWLNHDKDTFIPDRNTVFGNHLDENSKPDLISLVKMNIKPLENYSFHSANEFKKVTHINITKTRKNTDKYTKTNAILLKNDISHVVINEKYFKSFKDCEFYISDLGFKESLNPNEIHCVIVFGDSKVIGVICPMFENDYNYIQE